MTTSRPFFSFFFNDTATTETYTLSLHDALPISPAASRAAGRREPVGLGRPPGVRVDGSQRPDDDHRDAHARGRREGRQHGRDDGADRRVPRRGDLALGRLVYAAVRAAPDGGDRAGDWRYRGPHVHAYFRAC